MVVAHSPLTRRMVIPRVEAMLNATIEGGDVSIGLDGMVTVRNAVLRMPAVPGTAGAVFEVKRINARPSWSRLLGGGAPGGAMVSEVELVEPVVRFSQSVTDGSMNIAALDLPSPKGGAADLPRITVRRGILELGEHWMDDQGRPQYRVLKQIDIDGAVSPSKDFEHGVYRIAVQQIEREDTPPRPDVPRPRLLDLQGTVSERGVSVTMSGLLLDDWPASAVPSRVRGLYESLGLQGRIRRTRFDLNDRDGMRAEMEFEDVAVNLPIDATEEPLEGPKAPEPPARMRSVNGTVRFLGGSVEAELNGLLEDLPYRVRLKYLGLTPDAAFECDFVCENFRMEEKPQILRFAPPLVRYRLAQFSNPTGLVTARAHVSRERPVGGEPGELKVGGTLEFSDVTAAYASFPYRFSGIKGFVRFDDRSLDIVSLEGGSAEGGRISAKARISPLTDAAGAHIEVLASGVPIGERLEEAMGTRRRLVQEIASAEQYRRLSERGAFLAPERETALRLRLEKTRMSEAAAGNEAARTAARSEIAAIEASLRAPVFPFRGSGDVSITIDRREGDESVWTELIDVRLGKVGLLPDRFPMPILSEGVHVVIDGETVKVQGGTYRGLTGGTAVVSAEMLYPTLENPDIDPLPRAHIEAKGIPIDAVLAHAVAGAVDRATRTAPDRPEGESAVFVRTMLSGLRLSGRMDAVTDLTSDADGTHVATEARSADLVARPRRGETEVEIRASEAAVRVSDSRIDVDVNGKVVGAAGAADAGNVALKARVDMARSAPTRWSTDLRATDLDLTRPMEVAVNVFSESAADRIERLRENADPRGRAGISAVLSGGGEGLAGEVALEALKDASLNALGERLTLTSEGGAVRISPFAAGREDVVRFDNFRATAASDGVPAGRVFLDGEVSGLGTAVVNGALRVGAEGARFEHPLVRRLARDHAGAGLHDAIERTRPEGAFDAELAFAPGPSGMLLKRGTVRPRSLALTLDTGRAEWPEFSGEIEFEPESGAFHALHGRGKDEAGGVTWSFDAGGSWVIPAPGAVAVKADLSLESRGVPAGLLAVLPAELTGAMNEISFKAQDGIRVPRATVTYNDDGTSAGRSVRVNGQVELMGVALEAGVPVTDCRGTLDFDVRRPAGAPTTYDVWGLLSGFKFAGMAMTDGRLRLSGGGESGAVLVPLVAADCYGGRASGEMSLRRGADGSRRYEANMKLSGVRFAPVARDLGAPAAPSATGQAPAADAHAGADTGTDPVALDESRGRLDANFSLAGIVGDDESRRGRGSGTVGGGSVVNLPLVLALVQFSNLQLPFGERLRLATAEFFLNGKTIVFEDVSAFTDSVRIFGYGTATWPGLDLNLRFNSRAVRRVPVISGMLESIRDEIVSTSVTGNIRDPKISTTPLSGTAGMLESLFGSRSDQDRLMQEIERRAVQDLDRIRTTGERESGARPVAPRAGG